jgi:hypothetical protein
MACTTDPLHPKPNLALKGCAPPRTRHATPYPCVSHILRRMDLSLRSSLELQEPEPAKSASKRRDRQYQEAQPTQQRRPPNYWTPHRSLHQPK